MSRAVDPLVMLVLLLNFSVLGTSRVRSVINGTAAQGAILGLLMGLVHRDLSVLGAVVVLVTLAVKSVLIPAMLHRAMRDAAIRREVEPLVGFIPSLLLGGVGTGAAVLFSGTLPLAPEHQGSLLVAASLSTVLTGFILLTTRRKAITQVVGYLILDNGVFLMGLLLVEAMPFLVELGVLLDLLVGIFVMGIIINHINREFSSLDTARLTALKE